MDTLLCRVDHHDVAIPTAGLVQIVEVEITPPPPDAMPWIAGLAIFAENVVAVVALAKSDTSPSAAPVQQRRLASGLLFGGGSSTRWIVEVSRVVAVADVRAIPHTTHLIPWITACQAEWFLDGVTQERHVLPLLDVGRVAAALSFAP